MDAPHPAEQARTAVAQARLATLTTYPRLARPALTTVSVADQDGGLLITVRGSAPAVADLALRPLATVRVAPAFCEPVTIQGEVQRLPNAPCRSGGSRAHAEPSEVFESARFRLEVGAVRLGTAGRQVVDVQDYWAAEPDPLREDAPGILAHLRRGHGATLAACLRAQGRSAAVWAEPSALDRYGLQLVVLEPGGVSTVRLQFTALVRSVDDLGRGLSVVLRGSDRCGACQAAADQQGA